MNSQNEKTPEAVTSGARNSQSPKSIDMRPARQVVFDLHPIAAYSARISECECCGCTAGSDGIFIVEGIQIECYCGCHGGSR
jgi:hypothetical protein